MQLADLYRLASVTRTVITFGFLQNLVSVVLISPMENNLPFENHSSTTVWITTSADILDKGRVPILFSVEQMRNLRMNIEHTPGGGLLACPMFGMRKTPLAVSTSNQPILDIMSLATAREKSQQSFMSHALAGPACEGKHEAHTYKEGCK